MTVTHFFFNGAAVFCFHIQMFACFPVPQYLHVIISVEEFVMLLSYEFTALPRL